VASGPLLIDILEEETSVLPWKVHVKATLPLELAVQVRMTSVPLTNSLLLLVDVIFGKSKKSSYMIVKAIHVCVQWGICVFVYIHSRCVLVRREHRQVNTQQRAET